MTAPDTPDLATILDWLDGRLPADHAAVIADRLRSGDSDVERILAWARAFRSTSRQLPLPEPPPLLQQRLRRLFDVRGGVAATPVAAALLTDSRREARLAGARAADAGGGHYQLLYRHGDAVDVILDVEPAGRRCHVRGQVLVGPGERPVFEAVASWPGGSRRALDGDEYGGFTLRDLPADIRSIVLTNDDLAIELSLPPAPG